MDNHGQLPALARRFPSEVSDGAGSLLVKRASLRRRSLPRDNAARFVQVASQMDKRIEFCHPLLGEWGWVDMGWRFRKSLKLLPGIKLNVGKKSASIRLGGKSAGYTVSTTGRKTASTSIPGTGVGLVSKSGGKRQRSVSLPQGVEEQVPSNGELRPAAPRLPWKLMAIGLAIGLIVGWMLIGNGL